MSSPTAIVLSTRFQSYATLYEAAPPDTAAVWEFRTNLTQEATTTKAKRLVEKVFATSERQHHAFLALAYEGENARVILLHRPSRCVTPMGLTGQDQCFVFMGDMHMQVPPQMVYWPVDAMRQTSNVRIPTATILDTAFAADLDIVQVGPYADHEPGTEVATTRKLMYLPPQFVPLILPHPSLSPREAWEIIGGAIRQDADAEAL
jgi:hypothetical protein